MRLIDADKIRYSDLSDGLVPDGVWCTWKDRIDAMPTVEAIPIEWIKQQLEKEEYRTFLVDYIEWRSCLDWLLEAWEEENEIN